MQVFKCVHLNNYFRLHVCLSFRTSVRPYLRTSVRPSVRTSHFHFFYFLQLFHKMSLIKVAWHVLRMIDMHPGSSSDPSGTAAAEAKPRYVYSIKTTWSEFQMPSQNAPAEAKPRCLYSFLKPHGQSFITSPESVQSSFVR